MTSERSATAAATMLIVNILKIRPAASLDDARRIAPALKQIPDADLAERMAQARSRLGIPSPKLRRDL